MQDNPFISRLEDALFDERRAILDAELKTDYSILQKQRQGESVPPKHYWALKTFPVAFQNSYIECLRQKTSVECEQLTRMVLLRAHQTEKLVLMEWAERPSMEISGEQLKAWATSAKNYIAKTRYYENQLRQLCKKPIVKRAFRECFFETTGRRMRSTEESSIFRDEEEIQIGDARIVVEWDCGGWDHFREEISIEWKCEQVLEPQSICSWLGYFAIGAEGWFWILQKDLERAAHDAVQQTIQFRDILCKCVHKAME